MDYTATNTYTRSYQYDKLGNIQYLSHKAAGHANPDFERDYTYDGSDNKLRAFTVNSNLFQNKYDPSGNLAQEGQSRFYEWTANDKMAVFKTQAGSSTPSVFTNYFYNAQGERIKKHTRKGNKVIVTFFMDGGMFETSYVKPTGGSIDSKRFYNTLKIEDEGALIATIRVGKNVDDHTPAIKYIVGDHLNNSTAVLKTTGTLINREEFYPFGETSFGGFQFKRYRYNGKEKDEESGLYEYGQRYYAPWVCRFVSVDPVAEDYPHLSSYNYAGNKPVSKKDLEGLQEENAEKQGGSQTDSGGNLTGEYVVKDGQGPTQIAKDLRKVHGVDIDWTSVIDDPRNQEYFSSVSKDERYDKSNKEYENLNLNPGDILYFDLADETKYPEKNRGNSVESQKNNNDSASASSNTSSMMDDITFIPQFTAKFEFGAGIKVDTPAKAIGFTANYASLNFVGFENNDWYFAGKNVSEDSDVREINEEYSFSAAGYGISRKSIYENGREGVLKQRTTTMTYRSVIQNSVIELPQRGLIINQTSLNFSVGFGAVLMPEIGVNIILYSDTIR